MKRVVIGAVLLGSLCTQVVMADVIPNSLYVTPTSDGFEVYVAAAMTKKKVPVTIVTDPAMAQFTLKASEVEVQKVSTGAKVVSCLFAYCAGSEDKGSTSVQVVDSTGIVRWSYAVNKQRGGKNKQSMAEAIAKHFKDEFMSSRR
jgi:predicted transcriptional regulator YdeE